MSLDVVLLVASTALGLAAAAVLVAPARADTPPLSQRRSHDPGVSVRAAIAVAAAMTVVALTGWLVPAVVIAAAAWNLMRAWQHRSRSGAGDVERTDALASWIENLRDVLLAGDQPIGAITATVPTTPACIRPAVRRLAAALGHQDPQLAFRRFADELDDPLGDLVAAGLLIAVQRGARTVAVLTSLAGQARTQADRRRLVEAERAPLQREVHLLSLIMGSLVVSLLVFGRAEYLAPYDTGGGQLFLAVVLVIYAALLLRVQRLARFPRPSRFLTSTAPSTQTTAIGSAS